MAVEYSANNSQKLMQARYRLLLQWLMVQQEAKRTQCILCQEERARTAGRPLSSQDKEEERSQAEENLDKVSV